MIARQVMNLKRDTDIAREEVGDKKYKWLSEWGGKCSQYTRNPEAKETKEGIWHMPTVSDIYPCYLSVRAYTWIHTVKPPLVLAQLPRGRMVSADWPNHLSCLGPVVRAHIRPIKHPQTDGETSPAADEGTCEAGTEHSVLVSWCPLCSRVGGRLCRAVQVLHL